MRSAGTPQYSIMTVTHMVPASRIGLCIGKGGETVRTLQDRSGAKIIVTPDRDTDLSAPDRPIAITGTAEMIALARQLIDELVYSVLFLFIIQKSTMLKVVSRIHLVVLVAVAVALAPLADDHHLVRQGLTTHLSSRTARLAHRPVQRPSCPLHRQNWMALLLILTFPTKWRVV